MNIFAIAFGFLFFLNPMRHVIDIIPDVIGCLFILVGLRKAAWVVEKLDTAREFFWKVFLVTLLRTASILLVSAFSESMRLLMTFAFDILELIFLLPAISALIDGFVYAGMRFGGDSVMRYKSKKQKVIKDGVKTVSTVKVETVEGLKRFTFVFLLIRAFLNVVPELTSLQDQFDSGLIFADFYELIFGMCAFVCLIIGIVWGIAVFRYFAAVAKDPVLVPLLRNKLETEILPNKYFMTGEMMRQVPLWLILLSVFSADIYMDQMNIFPGVLTAVFFVLLFVQMKAHWCFTMLAVGYGILSGVTLYLQNAFLNEHNFRDVAQWDTAFKAYIPVETVAIMTALLGVAAVALLWKVLYKRFLEHLLLIDVDASTPENRALLSRQDKSALTLVQNRMRLAMGLVMVSHVMGGVFVLLVPYMPVLWLLNLLVCVASVMAAASLNSALADYPYRMIKDLA